jgi:hypothetical protein
MLNETTVEYRLAILEEEVANLKQRSFDADALDKFFD